uniref:Dachshund b n=1 Tax=Neogobius melanostomus TaxID=47308 RepID=A0A8C6SAT7_9GOBI
FSVDGQELICLPQVFDLFLKHLVGGLHTVYTKLKRLDIAPVVCTVEQVRVLRGLGAIQDFETLYQDCTTLARAVPQTLLRAGLQEGPRLLHPGLPGLLSPNLLSHSGLTAAAMAELQKLQKMKMMMSLQNGNESDNEDLHSNTGNFYYECSWEKERLTSPRLRPSVGHLIVRFLTLTKTSSGLELPFMMMPHPLLPMGLPPASVAMQIHTHVHRAPVIKERVCDSPSLSPSGDENTSPLQSQPSSSASSSPERLGNLHLYHLHPFKLLLWTSVLFLSFIFVVFCAEESSLGQTLPPGFPAPFLFADGLSSVETLLTNIQGLLKVAVENARVQDKQIQAEKRELKMELFREREMRESLERQLTSELQSRASIQKRLKKEKKAKRKLQEALEFESKRRERVEDALKHSSSSSPSPEPHEDEKTKMLLKTPWFI